MSSRRNVAMLAAACALVPWTRAFGQATEIFDTQDDWQYWEDGGQNLTTALTTSAISYTNGTNNGAGNPTNPDGTPVIGAGSLQITLGNSSSYGQLVAFNNSTLNLANNQTFLTAFDPGGTVANGTAAYNGTAFIDYTQPSTATYMNLGLLLQYPGNGYYGVVFATSTTSLGVVDGQQWYQATIPYTILTGASNGFGFTIMESDGGSTSGSTMYIDSVFTGTPVVVESNNATWTHGGTGNWSSSPADSNNWVGGTPPQGTAPNVTFDDGTDHAHVNVNVEAVEGVNNLTFNNANGFSLNGSEINVQGTLTSTAGANTINTLDMSSATATVSISSGSSVSATNFTHAAYSPLVIIGGGTFNVGTIGTGNVDVNGGSSFNITGSVISVNQSTDLYDIGVATVNDSVNLGQNNVIDNNSLSGNGTITIGAGTTLTSAEYNGFNFAGNLAGSGSLILGNEAGASANTGAPYQAEFTGTNSGFTGSIDAQWETTLALGAGAGLGSGTLTLDSGSVSALGTTTLSNAIVLNDTQDLVSNITTIDVSSGNSLTLSGNISGPNTVQKTDSGVLVLSHSNSYTGGTNVNGGTLVVAHNSALPPNSTLSISSAAVQLATGTGGETLSSLTISSGTLDVGNNHVIINYSGGSDPKTTILGYLSSGSNGGAWNGATGIISSAAAATTNYGVSFSDGADNINPALTSGQIEVAYSQYGDITQQGLVNAADFHILASNFGQVTTKGWEAGDFLYQGVVNANDFHLLASNFGQTASGESVSMPASDWAAIDAFEVANGLSVTVVPEPVTFALVGGAAMAMLMRRRRRPSVT